MALGVPDSLPVATFLPHGSGLRLSSPLLQRYLDAREAPAKVLLPGDLRRAEVLLDQVQAALPAPQQRLLRLLFRLERSPARGEQVSAREWVGFLESLNGVLAKTILPANSNLLERHFLGEVPERVRLGPEHGPLIRWAARTVREELARKGHPGRLAVLDELLLPTSPPPAEVLARRYQVAAWVIGTWSRDVSLLVWIRLQRPNRLYAQLFPGDGPLPSRGETDAKVHGAIREVRAQGLTQEDRQVLERVLLPWIAYPLGPHAAPIGRQEKALVERIRDIAFPPQVTRVAFPQRCALENVAYARFTWLIPERHGPLLRQAAVVLMEEVPAEDKLLIQQLLATPPPRPPPVGERVQQLRKRVWNRFLYPNRLYRRLYHGVDPKSRTLPDSGVEEAVRRLAAGALPDLERAILRTLLDVHVKGEAIEEVGRAAGIPPKQRWKREQALLLSIRQLASRLDVVA